MSFSIQSDKVQLNWTGSQDIIFSMQTAFCIAMTQVSGTCCPSNIFSVSCLVRMSTPSNQFHVYVSFGLMFLTFFSNDCHNCAQCWRCEEAQKTPPMLWCVKMFFTQATILVFKHSFVHVAHWMPIQKSHCTHSIVLDCCGSILTEQIQIKVSFCHINHMKKLILQLSLLNCSSSPLWAEQEADVAFPKR